MAKGWVKLHRSLQEHWIFQDPLLLKIWIDILLTANHEPSKVPIKNQLIEIHPGQFWTSIRTLADRWNINFKTVQKKLFLLQSDGMIFVDSRAGYGTLITVRNYEKYQLFSDDDGNRKRNRKRNKVGIENETENGHKQEDKNVDNDKEGKEKGLSPGAPDYFEEV